MVRTKSKLLTEVELELIRILWKLKRATVKDLLKHVSPDRKMAYTSASTIIRILEKKGVVGSDKEGRTHVYFPLLSKEDYEAKTLTHMIDQVFDRTPTSLVRRLVSSKLSEKEREEIRRIIEEEL